MTSVLTPAELRELLVTILAGAAGGTVDHWRKVIGDVEKLPTHLNVKSNWTVHPRGSTADLEAVERALEIVRSEHPYVVT